MPLAGGIVHGDKYSYILSVGSWVAGALLLIGAYIPNRRHYVLCRFYGVIVFLSLFVLGGTLVSLQLKQAEYQFPDTETLSVYQVPLVTKPEIEINSILFRTVLKGEVRDDTLLHASSEKVSLFYFPKGSAADSLKRGGELPVRIRSSAPAGDGNPDELDYTHYLPQRGTCETAYIHAGRWRVIGCDSSSTFRQQASGCRDRVAGLYRDMGLQGDELVVSSALTADDKEELSKHIIETYSIAGISHVLVFSGLHIGLTSAPLPFFLSPL